MKKTLPEIKLPRPDKLLQKRVVALAYSLTALTVFLIAFVVNSQYLMFFLSIIGIMTLICLLLAIETLKAAEEAVSFGGFANEIIRQSSNAKRIETFAGKIILENDLARDLFAEQNILDFLQRHLTDYRNNNFSFQKLKNALSNLSPVKVTLALNANGNRGIENAVWFQISLKTVSLRRTDFFEHPFSIKKIRKDVYLYWSFRDITAEHNIEQVFQSERSYMHDFLDYMPTSLYINDKDYRIEYCNHAFATQIGRKREDLLGLKLTDFLATNSAIPPYNTEWSGMVHFLDAQGNVFETCIKQTSFREGNEIKIRAVAMTDLPNDQTLHRQLSHAVDEISWLFDFSPIAILLVDKDGKIGECNRQTEKFVGSALQGTSIYELVSSGGKYALKREISNILNREKEYAPLDITLNGNHKTATLYITPMKRIFADSHAEIDGLVIYIIDTTEQKNLELQFAQAQKMQAMGQLAGGVAHDFNNLLTAIIGFSDLLLQRHGIGDPSFADLNQIKNNANRAAGLVRQLLAFSRKQPCLARCIDITDNFMELSQMLKWILGEKILLKFHHGENLGFVKVDPVQFSQVIINLAVNAKDAMNGNGVLTIATYTEQIKNPQQFGDETVASGDFVVIEVKDTGCGIAKENLNRIFEPFFSTKQNVVGSGTGLGLATVYGIVHQAKGYIKVDSVVNQGTTFSVYLPRFETNIENENNEKALKPRNLSPTADSTIINVRQRPNQPLVVNQKFIFGINVSAIDTEVRNPHAGVKIMFVDDEDSVRNFAVIALRKKGFEVISCNSAENALEQLKDNSDLSMLITDMVMPGMNGMELGKIVAEKVKNIKIILASGYSEEIAAGELSKTDNFEFLAKPFSLGDLINKIFEVLNKG